MEKGQTVHFWLGTALTLSYSLSKHCGFIIAANVGGKDQELRSFPQETLEQIAVGKLFLGREK